MAISQIPAATAISGTLPIANGGTGTTNGPTFWAVQNANAQTYTGTSLKLVCDSAVWNVGNCYSTSTYTFTPTVAGYYQVVASLGWAGGAIGITNTNLYLYKNGTEFTDIRNWYPSGAGNPIISGTFLVYMNGTTDYINIYFDEGGAGSAATVNSGQSTFNDRTYFGAFLARAA